MFENIVRRFRSWIPGSAPTTFVERIPPLVLAATAVAAVLRIYHLGTNPPGLFCDEAIIGVLADSLLRTGRDTEGRWFPILFHGFGSWRPAFSVYAAIPWIKMFGVTEFATRLSSALYGTATVPAVYVLGRRFFGKNVGIFAALLLATLPWHLHLSRIQFDTAMSVFYMTLLLISLDQLRKGEKLAGYMFWFSVAGFFFSYPSAPVQLAGCVPFALYVLRHRLSSIVLDRRNQYATLIFGIPFLAVVGWACWTGLLFARFKQVRPPNYTFAMFLTGYVKHFTHAFLATLGEAPELGAQPLRHSIQHFGLLMPGAYAFFLIGILFALRSAIRRDFSSTLVGALLLVAPIPAAMVSMVPGANRSAVLLLPVVLLTALGIERLRERLPLRLAPAQATFAVVVWLLVAFVPFRSAWERYGLDAGDWMSWQYGYDDAVHWAADHQQEYDRIYVTHQFNGPDVLSLFYRAKWKCQKCEVMTNPATVGRYDREFFFVREGDIPDALKRYPDLQFVESIQIREPNGKLALRGGQFLPKTSPLKGRATASDESR